MIFTAPSAQLGYPELLFFQAEQSQFSQQSCSIAPSLLYHPATSFCSGDIFGESCSRTLLLVDFSPTRSVHWALCCGSAQQGKINDSHFHRKKCNFQSHSNCPFNTFKPSVTKCLTLTRQLLMLQAGPPTPPSWKLRLCIPESPKIRRGMLPRRSTVKYKNFRHERSVADCITSRQSDS